MYKAIIADDEIRICMLLRKLADWDKLGIEIVGECHDGLETYHAIQEKQPDIVISDIQMPHMNGLEIVKVCNEENIKCAFLLISGHAEFEYARMAIRYNVGNYLLKPINKEELENNLRDITKRLGENEQVERVRANIDKRVEMDRNVLHTQFLSNLIQIPEWIVQDSVENRIVEFHLDFPPNSRYCIMALEVISKTEYTEQQHRLLLKQVESYARHQMEKQHLTCMQLILFPCIYAFLTVQESEEFEKQIQSVLEKLQNRFFEYCEISLGISTKVDKLSDISMSSRVQAECALRARFNLGNGKAIFFEHLRTDTKRLPLNDYLQELRLSMETADVGRLERLFANLGNVVDDHNVELDDFFELIQRMQTILRDVQRTDDESQNEVAMPISADSKITLLHSLHETARSVALSISETQNSIQNQTMRVAMEYIENHYAEDISLNALSSLVYMHPTYFSSLFKQVTGKTFSDFLQEIRIEHAKTLLSTTLLPIADVAERIGYKSAHYFSKVFLRVVGLKPSEYRRLYLRL